MKRIWAVEHSCSVDECDRVATRRGWCSMHYKRWKTHGDPTKIAEPARWKRRNRMTSGYWRIWDPEHPLAMADGYVLEHRKIWYDTRGSIPDGWHVHHVNGYRDDNRIENLEALSAFEHHSGHIQAAGEVTNQYGTFPLKRVIDLDTR